jgi:hypothetical protein
LKYNIARHRLKIQEMITSGLATRPTISPYRDPLQNGSFSTAYATQMLAFDVTLMRAWIMALLKQSLGPI